MARSPAIPLVAALTLSLFSYCMALLVSREAPIPYLVAGGFGALALLVASMYCLWFQTDYERTPENFRITSTDQEGD